MRKATRTSPLSQGQVFRDEVTRAWLHTLRRRSQRHRMTWSRMRALAERWNPRARVLHPWPDDRFYANTRGRSPAVVPLAGICAGDRPRLRSRPVPTATLATGFMTGVKWFSNRGKTFRIDSTPLRHANGPRQSAAYQRYGKRNETTSMAAPVVPLSACEVALPNSAGTSKLTAPNLPETTSSG